jgi:hypothetical protein
LCDYDVSSPDQRGSHLHVYKHPSPFVIPLYRIDRGD